MFRSQGFSAIYKRKETSMFLDPIILVIYKFLAIGSQSYYRPKMKPMIKSCTRLKARWSLDQVL